MRFMGDKDDRILELEHQVEELKRQIKEQMAIIDSQATEIKALKTKLDSKKPSFVKANIKPTNPENKGSKKGHPGHGRKNPDYVDRELNLYYDECPHCKTKLNKPTKTRPRFVTDIEPPKRGIVIKYNEGIQRCPSCKKILIAKPDTVLPNCRFGLTLMLFVTLLKIGLSLPYNKIRTLMSKFYGINMSESEITYCINKMADIFEPKYDEWKKELKSYNAINIDETGRRINGINHWLWAFVTKTISLYVVDKSRGSKVVEEVIGKDYKGCVGSDYFSAYNPINCNKQKCWVHLLRDTSKIKKKYPLSDEAKQMHDDLKQLQKDAKEFLKTMPTDQMKKHAYDKYLVRLDEITGRGYTIPDCHNIAERLKANRNYQFQFVIIDEVKPDNNVAEREIRPTVVSRKISGGNRSQKGAKSYQILMSVFQTYKRQNLDLFSDGRMHIIEQCGLNYSGTKTE